MATNMKVVIYCMVFLTMIAAANALECVHNEVINLQVFDEVDFVCESDNPMISRCVAMILENESLLQSFPRDDKALLDKYRMNNGIAKISFDVSFFSSYLEDNTNYTYRVLCGDETWEEDIPTVLKNYNDDAIRFAASIKNNLSFIIFIIFGTFILIVLIIIIWKVSKGGD